MNNRSEKNLKQIQMRRGSAKNKRALLFILVISVIIVVAAVISVCFIIGRSHDAPYFEGVKDISIQQGETVRYREGVKAYDYKGEELSFEVDDSDVNINIVGIYEVRYTATDKHKKSTTERISVTVRKKPKVAPEVLYALIDEDIEVCEMRDMSREELCKFLYKYIKETVTFVNDSDKSDYIGEAYRAMTEYEGDCFTYYAVARVYFERCGVEVKKVERKEGARDGTHFWLLVNMGSSSEPEWYHWDCCPHHKDYPFYSCLVTDDELLAYNEKVTGYYTFDRNKYPKTPTETYW